MSLCNYNQSPDSPLSASTDDRRSQPGPMTSPPRDLDEPFEDEAELIGGDGDRESIIEEEDGEELFGDNLEA